MALEVNKELACAVIKRAVEDATRSVCVTADHRRDKADGINFIKTKRLDVWIECYGLDINADYLRKCLNKQEA